VDPSSFLKFLLLLVVILFAPQELHKYYKGIQHSIVDWMISSSIQHASQKKKLCCPAGIVPVWHYIVLVLILLAPLNPHHVLEEIMIDSTFKIVVN